MASEKPLLSQLLSRNFFHRFQVLYEGGRTTRWFSP